MSFIRINQRRMPRSRSGSVPKPGKCCQIIVDKTSDMRYNEFIHFAGVTERFQQSGKRTLYALFFHDLSTEDYVRLRSSVGWTPLIREQAQSCLENSDFIVSCRESDETVGCARVFWDKGYIAYLADVIVMPAYQGHGIGKALVSECIKYIDSQLKEGWRIKIVLVSAKGKEAFYEKLGFQIRPNEEDGAGMDLWRQLG